MAGSAAFDFVHQGGTKALGKIAGKFGVNIFEKAAAKTGLKLLSSSLKASEVGAVLGTALDVGLEAQTLKVDERVARWKLACGNKRVPWGEDRGKGSECRQW